MGLAMAGAQRQRVVVIALRLGDDQFGIGKFRLHRGRNARDQAAAGGRRDHDIGRKPARGHVLGDLAAGGALPCDHEGIVIGAHQRGAALARDAARDGFAVFLVAVVQHDLGAIGLGALALGQRRSPWASRWSPAC